MFSFAVPIFHHQFILKFFCRGVRYFCFDGSAMLWPLRRFFSSEFCFRNKVTSLFSFSLSENILMIFTWNLYWKLLKYLLKLVNIYSAQSWCFPIILFFVEWKRSRTFPKTFQRLFQSSSEISDLNMNHQDSWNFNAHFKRFKNLFHFQI